MASSGEWHNSASSRTQTTVTHRLFGASLFHSVWKGAAETLDPWTPPRLTTAFYAHALVGGGALLTLCS
eukprot:29780-Eustigmatos_ZCMA.PRE.1